MVLRIVAGSANEEYAGYVCIDRRRLLASDFFGDLNFAAPCTFVELLVEPYIFGPAQPPAIAAATQVPVVASATQVPAVTSNAGASCVVSCAGASCCVSHAVDWLARPRGTYRCCFPV